MFRVIPDLISVVTAFVPSWALGVLAVALVALAIPPWLRSVRSKQIRNRLRWVGRAHGDDERAQWAGEAFELAGDNGLLLVVLAEEAHKLNQLDLFKRAMSQLRAMPGFEADIARLDKQSLKEKPRYRHPVEAAVVIEKLAREGMTDEAVERLNEAMQLFPGDSDLQELSETLR